MKKVLSMLLAVSMLGGTAVTAFAKPTYSNYSGGEDGYVFLESMDDDDFELEPGEEYRFDLVNKDGSNIEEVTSFKDYDEDDDDVYKVSVTVKDGKSYISSCKIDDNELVIKPKNDVDRDKKVTIRIKAKGINDSGYKYTTYKFTVIGNEDSRTSDEEEIDEDEWDIDLGDRYTLKFDRDLARCAISFDDEVFLHMRFASTYRYTMECDDEENKKVMANAPDAAELKFYRFTTKNNLEYEATVRLLTENGEKYVYEIDSNNKLTELDAKKNGKYLEFKAKKLGAYVMSDMKLDASKSSSSSSTTTSKPTQSTSSSTSSSTASSKSVTLSSLKNALASVASNGTATVYISDNSYVKVADLKEAFRGNTGKQIKFVCKNGNKVVYQYYMNYRQVSAMTGTNWNLGLDMKASATTKLFNKYYKNDVVVVGSNASPNGAKAVFAAKADLSDLNTSNLKVYIYNRSKNNFELVSNPYLSIDRNNYVHYTVPVGYDVIFTDSYMTVK